MRNDQLSVYFAGELFSLKHLLGNAALAQAIREQSAGRYRCILPQNLEQRETTPMAIRNQDIAALLECDLGLFNFDGDEIDSGTVVEFMIAKFADIPSVVIRSDFRGGGDGGEYPWNLMLSNYPRTKVIILDAISTYQRHLRAGKEEVYSKEAASLAYDEVARSLIESFDKVVSEAPALPLHLREAVYQWLRLMPGSGFEQKFSVEEIHLLLQRKLGKVFSEC